MDGTEHEIPLGSFSIAHKPLHLQLDATIAVFVRQRSTVPYANNLDSTPDINDLLTAWVCRAAGLRLTLQTDGHGCPEYNGLSDDERVDLWAAICQQICNAELWKQLGLVASLHDENFLKAAKDGSERNSVQISIALKHNRDTQANSDRPARHQLQCPASPADIQPPAGIDIVKICEVKLRLTLIKYGRWYKKRRKDATKSDNAAPRRKRKVADIEDDTQVSSFDGAFEFKSDSLFTEDSGYFSSQAMQPEPADEDLWSSGPTDSGVVPEQSQQQAMADSQSLQYYDDEEDLFLPETESEILDECELGPVAGPSSYSLDCSRYDTTADAVSCLVDAALRLAISAEPRRLPAGILRKDDELEGLPHRLSRLIPTLFSPGYLAAVAGRAALIQTIAGALRDASKNASPSSLRAKLTELLGLQGLKDDHIPEQDEEVVTCTRNTIEPSNEQTKHKDDQLKRRHIEIISTHLWRNTMRDCLDLEAARKLQPTRVKQSSSQPNAEMSQTLDIASISEYDEIPGSDDSDLFSKAIQVEDAPCHIEPSDPCIFSEDDGDDEDDIDWLIRDVCDDEVTHHEDADALFAFLDEDDAPFHDVDAFSAAIAFP